MVSTGGLLGFHPTNLKPNKLPSKWGTYGEGDGEFEEPVGVAAAPDGSVYILESGNHRLQKFLPGP
jgi:glucose/arabinose dehydrogenase